MNMRKQFTFAAILFVLTTSVCLCKSPTTAEGYFNRGREYARNGDYDRAIADYNQAIGLNPNYADAYSSRGAVYGSKGNHDSALLPILIRRSG